LNRAKKPFLSFGTKEELYASMHHVTEQTESGIDLSGNLSLSEREFLLEQENCIEKMSEFVPNANFAELSNKKGETVV
jgi:hypothetical protein